LLHADFILSNPNRINKALKLKTIEKRSKDLQKTLEKKSFTLSKSIISLWENFEELCMTLSRLDGKMTFTEIESLSAWNFYRLKSYLSKINKPQPKNGTQENE
jgi:hypothetical protein